MNAAEECGGGAFVDDRVIVINDQDGLDGAGGVHGYLCSLFAEAARMKREVHLRT